MIDFAVIDTGAAEGGAGVATANKSIKFTGKILAIGLVYVGSPPVGTTDVIISQPALSGSHIIQAILTLTNVVTDVWDYPRRVIDDNVGAPIASNYAEYVVAGDLNVKIQGANDDDRVVATIIYEN